MIMECAKADLPTHIFESTRGMFKVVFRNNMGMPEEDIDKTEMSKAIVQFCTIPKSREELTTFTGKSRYYTMSMIVRPLIEQGLIIFLHRVTV